MPESCYNLMSKLIFIRDQLLYARMCSGRFEFNPHDNSVKWILVTSSREGNRSTERRGIMAFFLNK